MKRVTSDLEKGHIHAAVVFLIVVSCLAYMAVQILQFASEYLEAPMQHIVYGIVGGIALCFTADVEQILPSTFKVFGLGACLQPYYFP